MDLDSSLDERNPEAGWDGPPFGRGWLDEEAPDYHPRRFLAIVYRTTRALLAQKNLLTIGQGLNELDDLTFTSLLPIQREGSPFKDSQLPVSPSEETTPEEFEQIRTMHGYTALQIDIHPDDPCLQWLEDIEYFPAPEDLLRFELEFLALAGQALLHYGRQGAFTVLERFLGPVSRLERRDLMALPFAWVREMKAASTDDDRMLANLRLDSIILRAQDSLDLRVELAAIREQARIQGLTFQDEDRKNRDLLQLFRQPRKALPHG